MKVSEVMHTPAVTVPVSATLRDAARTMGDRNVGSVLVVDEVGYLTGVVTDRDIVLRGVAAGLTHDASVAEVMTRDVATISIHADVADATPIMVDRVVRRLPVVDQDDKPHGVISADDMLRQLGKDADALTDLVLFQTMKPL